MPPDLPALRSLSEAQFQAWVVKNAKAKGWMVSHVAPAQRRAGKWTTPTTPGWPDVFCLRPQTGQLVALELKRHKGKATPAQNGWIAGLQQVPGVEAFVVSPTDAAAILDLLDWPDANPA